MSVCVIDYWPRAKHNRVRWVQRSLDNFNIQKKRYKNCLPKTHAQIIVTESGQRLCDHQHRCEHFHVPFLFLRGESVSGSQILNSSKYARNHFQYMQNRLPFCFRSGNRFRFGFSFSSIAYCLHSYFASANHYVYFWHLIYVWMKYEFYQNVLITNKNYFRI